MKPVKRTSNAVIVLSGLMLGWMGVISGARAAEEPVVPDFTQGDQRDDSHDWTLGPTGARGWVYWT